MYIGQNIQIFIIRIQIRMMEIILSRIMMINKYVYRGILVCHYTYVKT